MGPTRSARQRASLRHVPQLDGNDCGIAVLAMILELPDSSGVRGLVPKPLRSRGIQVAEMLHFLGSLTGAEWRVEGRWPYRALASLPGSLRLEDQPCVVLVQETEAQWAHWIVVDPRPRLGWAVTVFDPEMEGAMRLEGYPRAHWKVIRSLMRVE